MVSLSNILEDSRTVPVEIGNDVLNVTYNPSTLSPAYMHQLTQEVDEDDPVAMGHLFCGVVTGWDAEGPLGAGEHSVAIGDPVPLDPEVIAWLPGSILRHILEAIGEDSAPKSRKKSKR